MIMAGWLYIYLIVAAYFYGSFVQEASTTKGRAELVPGFPSNLSTFGVEATLHAILVGFALLWPLYVVATLFNEYGGNK